MKENRFTEIDSENIEVSEMIKKDSRSIKISDAVNEKIIAEIRSEHKKKSNYTKIYKFGTAVAACLVFVVGMLVWNQENIADKGNDKISSKQIQSEIKENNPIVSATDVGTVAKSYDEIQEKIKEIISVNDELEYLGAGEADDYSPIVAPKDIDENKTTALNAGKTTKYSDTNEQTVGVHEGDVVKTDGKYIYTFGWNKKEEVYNFKINITEVNGKKMKKVSQINMEDKFLDEGTYVEEMYVSGDRLIVIVTKTRGWYSCGTVDGTTDSLKISGDRDSGTQIFIYDISDITLPKLISKNNQDGYYNSSRLVGGYLYTISTWDVYDEEKDYIPKINGTKMECDSICVPKVIPEASYAVITSLNIEQGKDFSQSLSVLGNTSEIYVSQNHIYLVNENHKLEDISKTKEGKKIIKKYEGKYNIYTKKKELSEGEIKSFKEEYEPEHSDSDKYSKIYMKDVVQLKKYYDEMQIIKYSYKNGELKYVAESTFDGKMDDRFSLDEKDGYLRLVIHQEKNIYFEVMRHYYDADSREIIEDEEYSDGNNDGFYNSVNSNTVYTLDENLNRKGEISGLAKDERIYAARYLGNYGYFVTYEETDPLFSVDFTDMENPKIVGKLKMPGFSDYLQFYNENLLFGIGEDKSGSSIKMDMYDVSKGSAKLKTKLELKGEWHTSASYNPKTLLIDNEKNIIGFPATEMIPKENYQYGVKDYYLLYAYENGKFKQLCKLALDEYDESETRALYINDYLYVVTPRQIYAVNLNTNKIEGKLEFTAIK